ncbi:MAG: hypothetical protein R6U37_00350 [Dehalococcoidia bacterium]
MEKNADKRTEYQKQIVCPGCGQPITLDLQLSRIDGDLYIWFEGLCPKCRHKVVDPMPISRIELNEAVRHILSN